MKALEGALVAPAKKLGMDRVSGWEVTQQHLLRPSGAEEVEDGFRHLSTGPRHWSAGGGGQRHEPLQRRPFRIVQIGPIRAVSCLVRRTLQGKPWRVNALEGGKFADSQIA